MARRGENIYKRKDGRWEGRYRNGFRSDGSAKYSSVYGKSYSEVRSLLSEKRSGVRADCVKCKATFGELVSAWLNNIRNSVKESTYMNYLMKSEKHILPFFGKTQYEKLTVNILNDFISLKLSENLSSKYVADITILIKSVCKFAHRFYNYEDKAEFLSLPRCGDTITKKSLTNEQQNKLLRYLSTNVTLSGAGILLSMTTGMRIGELCALKWSDIDFKKSIITVSRTMQRIKNSGGETATKIVITSPKSRSSIRSIPIPKFILPILEKIKSAPENYLLTGKKQYSEPRTMQYRFKSILKKIKLPQVNFHYLRHMFATKCAASGFDVKTLSEILGHSSVEITLNRYVHSSMERKFQCMNLLSANLQSI